MNDINDIRDKFSEFYSNSYLLSNEDYENNLIVFTNLLKSKYKSNVYNNKDIDFVPYSIYLDLLEENIYEKLNINDKTKLEVEVSRIIKKTKDKKFEQLLMYVKNYIKDEDINEIKDLIVKIDLSKNILPVFFKNLNNIYNDVYAESLSNNEKLEKIEKIEKIEENKGKVK